MPKLVLVRHGESEWNLANRFTGWHDVDISERGEAEARAAARLLTDGGFTFDVAFTSVLKRAIRTLNIILDDMDLSWVPVQKHWRLNERHYGALQGLNKAETAAQYGDAQVLTWRRSFSTPPPALELDDERHARFNRHYAGLLPEYLPLTESLKETIARVLPYWDGAIAPQVRSGRQVIIAAHGNSIRALVMHLDRVSEHAITELNIPTGVPLVYELDDALRPIRHFYLGDPEAVARAAAAVAAQARASPAAG